MTVGINYVDFVYCECFFNTQLINQCTLTIYFVLLCWVSRLFLTPAILCQPNYNIITSLTKPIIILIDPPTLLIVCRLLFQVRLLSSSHLCEEKTPITLQVMLWPVVNKGVHPQGSTLIYDPRPGGSWPCVTERRGGVDCKKISCYL